LNLSRQFLPAYRASLSSLPFFVAANADADSWFWLVRVCMQTRIKFLQYTLNPNSKSSVFCAYGHGRGADPSVPYGCRLFVGADTLLCLVPDYSCTSQYSTLAVAGPTLTYFLSSLVLHMRALCLFLFPFPLRSSLWAAGVYNRFCAWFWTVFSSRHACGRGQYLSFFFLFLLDLGARTHIVTLFCSHSLEGLSVCAAGCNPLLYGRCR
jgi:hypothetical protein